MRPILLFFILLSILSCKKEDVLECKEIKYDETITATFKDKFCLENGFEFEIIEVNDAYCNCVCNMDCFHPGFLHVKITVVDNKQNAHNLEINDAAFLFPDIVSSLDNFIPSFQNVRITNEDCRKPTKPENITFDLVIKEK